MMRMLLQDTNRQEDDRTVPVSRHSGLLRGVVTGLAALALAAGLSLAGGFQSEAAPAVMSDGGIFDAAFYAAAYPDVAAVVGTSETKLYDHYKRFGKAEGRQPYDPALTAEELLQQTETEMENRVIAARKKYEPEGYDAAALLETFTGKKADSEDIQNLIRNVYLLNPAAPLCYIQYQFGNNTYTVGPELAMTVMKRNDDGTYVVKNGAYVPDEQQVRSLVTILESLFGDSSTKGKFVATDGRTVDLTAGKFGSTFANNVSMDVDAETKFLMKALTQNKTQSRVPVFRPEKDYVEVDMKNQKAYYYKDGKQVLATSVVTGNTGSGNGTPAGVYHIRAKVRDTYLVGENYKSFVSYWMPIIGNSIGLHDASWRGSFGGQIYRTSGSHGCINMPTAAAKKLFETAPTGTTVVVFS